MIYKKIIYLILIIIWMITVFMFSNQNGVKSQETSGSVTKIIIEILTHNKQLTDIEKSNLIEKLDYFIRKLAHFSIYTLGGILIYNYINIYNISKNKKISIAIIVGIIYAITDEIHQAFISNRSAQISDVCLDSLGILAGVTFRYILTKIKAFI